jgi:ketosteroid isomerase-like protein
MLHQRGMAESQIRALIEAWADAVRRHDLSGIFAHHEQDIVMFDVPPPLQSRGMDEYKKTWDLFCRYHKPVRAANRRCSAVHMWCPFNWRHHNRLHRLNFFSDRL